MVVVHVVAAINDLPKLWVLEDAVKDVDNYCASLVEFPDYVAIPKRCVPGDEAIPVNANSSWH